MIEIIGVRFKEGGKVYYFSPQNKQFRQGDLVITETARGTECGEVVIPNKKIPKSLRPSSPFCGLPHGTTGAFWNRTAARKPVRFRCARKKSHSAS